MEVLQVEKNVNWLPDPNICSVIWSSKLPPIEQITTAFGLIMDGDKMLLANLYRGWDTPGGHIEKGEKIVETLHREVYEETKVLIDNPSLIGYQKLEIYAKKPEGYSYPYRTSYQVHFFARVKDILPFTSDEETKDRVFFSFAELKEFPNLKVRLALIKKAFLISAGKSL